MAPSQKILFTVMPRSLSTNTERLPISVFVSPRLYGESKLGAFPDWVDWTGQLRERGMLLVFQAGANSFEARINPEPLQPELWRALFNEGTFVRSHVFDDNTQVGALSYSVRETLSVIKALYQQASVSLALPDGDPEGKGGSNRERTKRRLLSQMVQGLQVHWNERRGQEWRKALAHPQQSEINRQRASQLDHEGLLIGQPNQASHRQVAIPFSTFHHMPQIADQEPEPLKPDVNSDLDFHQALASLNSMPELLRALGLVLDFELPVDSIPLTAANSFATLSVQQANPNWEWPIPTETPVLSSAYVHLQLAPNFRIFCPAPRSMSDPAFETQTLGLLNLEPTHFGLAQVDIDGAMHKAIILAEMLHTEPGRNLDSAAEIEPAQHPTVYDADATLPSLRSGGFQLYADARAAKLLKTFEQQKQFNDAVEQNGAPAKPFFAEDLLRGYRLDVWDSQTNTWHSLHERAGSYEIGEQHVPFTTEKEEGFVQLSATKAVKEAVNATNDLYLHETIARWAGWSLSVPMPGKPLSKHGDPEKAIPQDGDPEYAVDQPATPFQIQTVYKVLPGSLPKLRFGNRYRIRVRAVDLCGNSMTMGQPFLDGLSAVMALPRDQQGTVYLRYEPVISPQIIVRDTRSITDPGSQLDRLVIRTFNSDPSLDNASADLTAADRHLVPPRVMVETAERLGLFDDPSGKLNTDLATYQLIAKRDAGEFQQIQIEVAGQLKTFPLEPAEIIDTMPHLPDPLARGVALRNLPGTPNGSLGHALDTGAPAAIEYPLFNDPNPRPGSATLIPFGLNDSDPDWQNLRGIRLQLSEPQPEQPIAPQWDPISRTLSVFLPKGQMAIVPLSSYLNTDDLKKMGMWQWLREYIERITITQPSPQYLQPGEAVDEIAHVLQRAIEGGHWMLTPPRLLTLVHAVQQPVGRPIFTALTIGHRPIEGLTNPLQTALSQGRRDLSELASITAWRRPGATDAYLLGALQIHGASTAKIDLTASWDDPIDDLSQPGPTTTRQQSQVDSLPLQRSNEHALVASGKEYREVGYYDPEHDQIAFVRIGNRMGNPQEQEQVFYRDAAPRHILNDTKRHRVSYTATATSRYQEYFAQDQGLSFTRSSEPVLVDVPASARPLAPSIQYVLPTFGWQRQTSTNMKRSVRFGGGLRIYLDRPWYSSGEGELLGVTLYSSQDGVLNDTKRQKWKPFISQWGMDPIWQTSNLGGYPHVENFPDRVERDIGVTLEEHTARTSTGEPGIVDVVGFPVAFDPERQLWYSDLTINLSSPTYAPFVRLALVRYQPHALPDARISRVVLADFAQLTPDRSALVTVDPHHPQQVRVVVSGVAPRGPSPTAATNIAPTRVRVRVQQRDPNINSDLGWLDVPESVAKVVDASGSATDQPDLALYVAQISFTQQPEPDQYRFVIEEYEYIAADYSMRNGNTISPAGRLIYAEVVLFDAAML